MINKYKASNVDAKKFIWILCNIIDLLILLTFEQRTSKVEIYELSTLLWNWIQTIAYDYDSFLSVRIIKWLIDCYFCQSLKKSEISTYYQHVHSSATSETNLTKQHSFH